MIDWNGNGRVDWGDRYMDYEIMNEIENDNSSYIRPAKPKKKKRPLTEEELERNGKVLRIFFIIIGLMFAIPVLAINVISLLFWPVYASVSGIIVSIVVLVLIVKNIGKHHKERKQAKTRECKEHERD